MIVYDGIKSEFLNSVMNGTIAEEVRQRIFKKMGRTTPKSEFDSWKNSLSRMYMVLADTSIPDHAGIAIEYNVQSVLILLFLDMMQIINQMR